MLLILVIRRKSKQGRREGRKLTFACCEGKTEGTKNAHDDFK